MLIEYNKNYDILDKRYLFAEVARRIKEYKRLHNDCKIISLGIGDVSLPLPPIAAQALTDASAEMGKKESFRGYCPERGYDFLIDAIVDFYKRELRVDIERKNVFISDGAKNDAAGLFDVFGDVKVLIPDPTYPVYKDSAIISGKEVVFLPKQKKDFFIPRPIGQKEEPYLIFLCSPDNPTGMPIPENILKEWVNFARNSGSVIVFDAAYERFIRDSYPRSIFEIEGAESCAVELNSLSKSAGFTGMRCSYLVCGKQMSKFEQLWSRRQSTKFNGTPYVIQRAAQSVLTEQGVAQCSKNIEYYRKNASVLVSALKRAASNFYGGEHSPYIWLSCPDGMSSFEFFDLLLDEARVAVTPGVGFGNGGEGYVRLSSFGDTESVREAAERILRVLA